MSYIIACETETREMEWYADHIMDENARKKRQLGCRVKNKQNAIRKILLN